MALEDKEILQIFDTLEEQGHPDPVGFFARSQILTKLDNSFSKDNKFGITGLRDEDAGRLETSAEELQDNLSAAVKTDLDNFAKYDDIANMHIAFVEGSEAVADRSKRPKSFLNKLNKEKKRWDKRKKQLEKNRETLVPKAREPQQVAQSSSEIEVSSVEGISDTLVEPASPQLAEPVFGNASRLESIRGSFQGLNLNRAEMPERRVSKSRLQMREAIRRALRNAG